MVSINNPGKWECEYSMEGCKQWFAIVPNGELYSVYLQIGDKTNLAAIPEEHIARLVFHFRRLLEYRPRFPGLSFPCRRMESRLCPASYEGPCGDRPCARFESNDMDVWT